MRVGCSAASRSATLARHASHSRSSRFTIVLNTEMSALGQPFFVITSSRQWRWPASSSRAGNHWAAWESPNSTIVVADVGSPKAHGPGSVTAASRWQPSW